MKRENIFLIFLQNKIRSIIQLKYIIIFISIIHFQPNCLFAKTTSFGLKSGIGFSKATSIDKVHTYSQDNNYPQYTYPPGFYASIFGEMHISNNYSIIAEFLYLDMRSQIKLTTNVEDNGGITELKYHGIYLCLPIQFKYQTQLIFSPYILTGLNIGYLIKIQYELHDNLAYIKTRTFEITSLLPSFNYSVICGIGNEFKMFNQSFHWEVKFLLGLTKYNPTKDVYLKSWRNNELIFGLGICF